MTLFLLMTLFLESGKAVLNPTTNYAVGDGFELEAPSDVAVAHNGLVFLLDMTAGKVFRWDGEGRFLGAFGSLGEGPGEWSFNLRFGGKSGYITSHGDMLYVYDGGSRKLHAYDLEGEFKATTRMQIGGGIPISFEATGRNRFFVFNNSLDQEPKLVAALYNAEGKRLKTLLEVDDKSTRRFMRDGVQNVEFQAFYPVIAAAYDPLSAAWIESNAAKPSFTVHSLGDESKTVVKVPIKRRKVTDEDVAAWREERSWMRTRPEFSAAFPEWKGWYDWVMPLEQGLWLAYTRAPLNHVYGGVVINSKGESRRFYADLGESGTLRQDRGRLFTLTLDGDGDWLFQRVSLTP